jgi:hypothetical protein
VKPKQKDESTTGLVTGAKESTQKLIKEAEVSPKEL